MYGAVTCQYDDGCEEVIPAEEVPGRYLAMQENIPAGLRQWCGTAYLVQDLAFVQSPLSDRHPLPDLRVGLEAQRIAAAVYHAARTGEEVDAQTLPLD